MELFDLPCTIINHIPPLADGWADRFGAVKVDMRGLCMAFRLGLDVLIRLMIMTLRPCERNSSLNVLACCDVAKYGVS